MQESDSNMFR